MRLLTFANSASALLLLFTDVTSANHGQQHERLAALNRKHHHLHRDLHKSIAERGESAETPAVEKRGEVCLFPTDAGLVAVTPEADNAGWAMSPDQPCTQGTYCPFACPPGQLSMQWDPSVTSYIYPGSMHGGMYCEEDGTMSLPFPDRGHCVDGAGTFIAQNKASQDVAICQTVLPGNEAMLIPTCATTGEQTTLAVPGMDYFAGTAAHYYINSPGIDTTTACVWGTHDNPWGNWAPYVAGANVDILGNTYTKIGWNPIWLEPATPFRDTVPEFGLRLSCDGECVGLPCAIDPSKNGVNEMEGTATVGAGGATFCVVTAPKGGSVYLEIFDKDGSSSTTVVSGNSDYVENSYSSSSPAPSSSSFSSSSPTPSPSSYSSSSASSTVLPSTSSTWSSSSITSWSSSSVVSSSSIPPSSTSSSYSASSLSSSTFSSTLASLTSSYLPSSSSSSSLVSAMPQMLYENATSVGTAPLSSSVVAATRVTQATAVLAAAQTLSASSASMSSASSSSSTSAASSLHLSLASMSLSLLAVSLTMAFL